MKNGSVRTVTLPDGSVFTMSDWGDYPLWSRAEMDPDASQDVIIFNYTQSQTIPGGGTNARATLVDTNMPTAGQLPLRHQMVVFAVMIRYDEAATYDSVNSADLKGCVRQNVPGTVEGYQEPSFAEGLRKWNNIKSNMIFQLVIEGNKPYVEGGLDHFPSGGGLWTRNSEEWGTPTQSSYYVNNGESGAHAGRRLAMPVHIGALEAFQGLFRLPRGVMCNWTNTRGSSKTGYGLTCVLNGPRQRPIG